MKKYLFSLLLLLAPALIMRGQQPFPRQNMPVQERKLAFLKERLMLNKNESEKLEKVFYEYAEQKRKLNERFKKEVLDKVRKGKLQELDEKEQMEVIDNKIEIDRLRYEIQRDYTRKLLEILPPLKVIMYFKLEREFNRKLMQRLKERRNGNAPPRPPKR